MQAAKDLAAADRECPLDPPDLVLLAQASMLIGKERDGADLLARAHQGFLAWGEMRAAARCAFWLGFTALLSGNVAQGSGWLSRAERVLENHPDCVERGYLLVPVGFRSVQEGNAERAAEAFARAIEIGEKFQDRDLVAIARQGHGRALIRQGDIVGGVAMLDEAMIAVTSGELSPLTAGGVYCSVLDACGEIFDLRRAQEWTQALDQWCASNPDMIPYQGHCMVRRAEILQLHGSWEQAIAQSRRACEHLLQIGKPEVGAAFYRLGELHRLRGESAAAEEAYRQAARWQRAGLPGLALLRLAQGDVESANAAIRRLAAENHSPGERARILDAFVEIVLAVKDFSAGADAANELEGIAKLFDAPFLHAVFRRAKGALMLAQGDPQNALALLRDSFSIWCEIEAPYEAARTRVLIAQACGDMEDCDAAELELELACEAFKTLGATFDLARAELFEKSKVKDGPLTAREVEVLRLVAAGKSNRAIGAKLDISEKTVARHLSNIFNKLNLTSRAAATAYAYKNSLV